MPDRVSSSQILLYQTEDRRTRIEVRLEGVLSAGVHGRAFFAA